MQCKKILLLIWLGMSSQIYTESQKENIEEMDEVQMELISSVQSVLQKSSEVDQPLEINPNFQLKNELTSKDHYSLDKKSNWNTIFYLYGQLEVVLPGGGFAVRTQKNSISFEVASSFIWFIHPAIKSTASLIKSFDNSGKGWYVGFGAGTLIVFQGPGATLDLPVFLGYQRSSSFWDLGVDFLPLTDIPFPLPTLRFGLGF